MGVLRQIHDHAFSPDARGDAVDQGRKLVTVMHMGIEIALLLHDDFGAAGGQADQIKTEAGIKRIIEGIEPFAKQAVDDLPLRHRPPRVDHDRAHYAVGAEKLASSRRAPLPCFSMVATSVAASRDKVVEIT